MNALKQSVDNVVSFEQAQKSVRRTRTLDGEQLPSSEETRTLRRQIDAAREYISGLAALAEAIDDDSSGVEIMGTLERSLEQLTTATSASAGALLVVDEDDGDLVYALAAGERQKSQVLWKRIPRGYGICQWVAEHGKSTIVNDAASDERLSDEINISGDFRVRSILAVPLLLNGRVLGVIELLNKKDGGYFTLNDQSHVTLLTRLSAVTLDKLGMPSPD